MPIGNNTTPVWELVQKDALALPRFLRSEQFINDMRERDAVGRKRYGEPLQAWNGRACLVDAYQEALDLSVYLKQATIECSTDLSLKVLYKLALVGAALLRKKLAKRGFGL